MVVLLIGAVCAYAAFRASRPSGLSGRGALGLAVVLVALVAWEVWRAGPAIRQYRIALLGMRYAVSVPGAGMLGDSLRVGGDYEGVDLFVDLPGDRDVARLWAVGDSMPEAVLVAAVEDAEGVVALQGSDPSRTRIAGARRLGPGTLVEVSRPFSARLRFVRARGGAWREEHALRDESGRTVIIPPARISWRDRVIERRPGPFQRTYPLADVLEQLDSGTVAGELSSFFFYEDGELRFVDLDSEVTVTGAPPAADTVWTAGAGLRRVTVAGLSFRDHPEPELSGPERYGLRALRAGRVGVEGHWLDFYLSVPEIRSFGRRDLEQLSLDNRTHRAPCAGADPVFQVHLNPVRQTFARRAVTFSAPPRRFESASQGVLSLPCAFTPGALRILSPSGRLHGETGVPFALGDGRREVIVRVDAKRLGIAGQVLIALLLLFPMLLLPGLDVPPAVRGLAVTVTGLVALRLLLGLSTAVEYPYLQEASQTGLWLAPVLPWAVLVAASRSGVRRPGEPWLHLAFALAMTASAWVLFVDSLGKQLVLGALPPLVWLAAHADLGRDVVGAWARAAFRGVVARGRAALAHLPGAVRALVVAGVRRARRAAAEWPGATFGTTLVVLRFVLAATGNNESLSALGTRVGISVVYTPLSLLLLVEVIRRHERARASVDDDAPSRSPMWRVIDVWVYLGLAFAFVALMVSDLGLALTTLPGALVFLLLVGERWSPPAGVGEGGSRWAQARRYGLRVAFAVPLVLFSLVQLQPRIPLEAGDASQPHFRMQKWKTRDLRLLELGDPAALQLIGQRRSEALGAMSETMRAYTRGPWNGAGYFRGEVSPELRATAAQEHVVSALLVGQWGFAGAAGLVLLLCALLAPTVGWWRATVPARLPPTAGPRAAFRVEAAVSTGWVAVGLLVVLLAASALLPLTGGWRWLTVPLLTVGPVAAALVAAREASPAAPWEGGDVLPRGPATAALFLFTLVFAGLYMVLANYGTVLFTGKNVYVLGLDSVGDVLESLVLFAGAAWLLARSPWPAAGR